MTKSEIFELLDNIIFENDFWLSEIDECYENNKTLINEINEIFKIRNNSDYQYISAVIKLLADNSKLIKNYIFAEIKDETYSLLQTRNELLIIATAFRKNPVFFSKCWNLIAITEHEIAEHTKEIMKEYSGKIDTMQNIFDFNKSLDFTYFFATARLLSDNYRCINSFLNFEKNTFNDIYIPTKTDLLLISETLKRNNEFYNIAKETISNIENKLESLRNELNLTHEKYDDRYLNTVLGPRIGTFKIITGNEENILEAYNFSKELNEITLHFSNNKKIILNNF